MHLSRQKKAHGFLTIGFVLITSFVGQVALNRQMERLGAPWVEPQESNRHKWDPVLFKTVSFGQLPATLDWMWMSALLDPSITHVTSGDHPQQYYDFQLISDLDPAFQELYLVAANILAVIRRDGPGARDLLLKGRLFYEKHMASEYPQDFAAKHFNAYWNVLQLLGYVYLFELNDMPKAAEAFQASALYPGAPTYLKRLSAQLSVPGGQYQVGLRLLNFMLEKPMDSRAREELERKRLNLFINQFLFETYQGFLSFLKAHPHYRANGVTTEQQMASYWRDFLKSHHIPSKDPWGGQLQLDEHGRPTTTTPHETVFGLSL